MKVSINPTDSTKLSIEGFYHVNYPEYVLGSYSETRVSIQPRHPAILNLEKGCGLEISERHENGDCSLSLIGENLAKHGIFSFSSTLSEQEYQTVKTFLE
jgi:hypothetical protein